MRAVVGWLGASSGDLRARADPGEDVERVQRFGRGVGEILAIPDNPGWALGGFLIGALILIGVKVVRYRRRRSGSSGAS